MAELVAVADEHVEDRHLLAVGRLGVVVAVVGCCCARTEAAGAASHARARRSRIRSGSDFATTARLSRCGEVGAAPSSESRIEVHDGQGVSASGSRAVSPLRGSRPGIARLAREHEAVDDERVLAARRRARRTAPRRRRRPPRSGSRRGQRRPAAARAAALRPVRSPAAARPRPRSIGCVPGGNSQIRRETGIPGSVVICLPPFASRTSRGGQFQKCNPSSSTRPHGAESRGRVVAHLTSTPRVPPGAAEPSPQNQSLTAVAVERKSTWGTRFKHPRRVLRASLNDAE